MRSVTTVSAVRLGRLGDLVMTLPALRWLAEHVRLQVVTEARYQRLMGRAVPGAVVSAVDDVPELEPGDVRLDLHGVASARRVLGALPVTSGARTVRVRKESVRRRALLWPSLGVQGGRTWPERHLDAARRTLEVLGVAGGPPPSPIPAIEPDSSAEPALLGLVPGAAHETKRWPAAHFAALADAWHERTGGSSVVLASDAEEAVARSVVGAHARWARDGDTPLLDLCASLARCSVVVAGDTGPLHLAGALGVPVAGLFGPTPRDAGFWVWGGRGVALSLGASCAPCSMHGARACHRPRRVCLDDLSPDRVLDAALSLQLRRAG